MSDLFSSSEISAKAYLVAAQKAGLMSKEELKAALLDIEGPKREAIANNEISQSTLPDIFEAVASVVSDSLDVVVDIVAAVLSD